MQYLTSIKKYFGSVKAEGIKIVWPDKKYVIHSTLMICGVVMISSFCLLGVDFLSNKLVSMLLKL